uniref:Scaffolding anchor of CK1 domain-containing protein n=1 Tax=Denticeps clupeoides TaxID=299321 RepID=A0AAY4DET1_9TELE
MALSQIQCLDENNVNLRIHESKAEFLYSEEQRSALEALFQDGRDAYRKSTRAHDVRDFLSDRELETLLGNVEVYSPGSDRSRLPFVGEAGETTVPSDYWPDRSDYSLPDLDIGWPDCAAYRGVTRATVYTQPPMDGQPHIKEVVRKTIANAQKVIAVVMDVFTDVDIFKDLLDAGFKRKVAVYIILEATGVPLFLSMCKRAEMHKGHLKNLRVCCTQGTEFITRSSKRVRGSLSQKFMFVDGDKAVSGSYSFTWTASRLDRNLITVLTGQAVDTFDKLFRDLYLTSSSVSLSQISLADEPEPEHIPQVAPVPLPSTELARKLINPKYALVCNSTQKSNGAVTKKNDRSKTDLLPLPKKQKERPEALPIHPGLLLERVNMIHYLPTWPEPDPPSDVIGFINIRDSSKPFQAHLMRSELFGVSQAIRFKDNFHFLSGNSSPTSKPNQQPSDPEHRQENIPALAPPVPKPRTVHLVISNDSEDGTLMVNVIKRQTVGSLSCQNDIVSSAKDSKLCDTSLKTPKILPRALGSDPESEYPSSTSTLSESGEDGAVVREPKKLIEADFSSTGPESSIDGSQAQSSKGYCSTFSTTSDEYFECNETVVDGSGFETIINGHVEDENIARELITTIKTHQGKLQADCQHHKKDLQYIRNADDSELHLTEERVPAQSGQSSSQQPPKGKPTKHCNQSKRNESAELQSMTGHVGTSKVKNDLQTTKDQDSHKVLQKYVVSKEAGTTSQQGGAEDEVLEHEMDDAGSEMRESNCWSDMETEQPQLQPAAEKVANIAAGHQHLSKSSAGQPAGDRKASGQECIPNVQENRDHQTNSNHQKKVKRVSNVFA